MPCKQHRLAVEGLNTVESRVDLCDMCSGLCRGPRDDSAKLKTAHRLKIAPRQCYSGNTFTSMRDQSVAGKIVPIRRKSNATERVPRSRALARLFNTSKICANVARAKFGQLDLTCSLQAKQTTIFTKTIALGVRMPFRDALACFAAVDSDSFTRKSKDAP